MDQGPQINNLTAPEQRGKQKSENETKCDENKKAYEKAEKDHFADQVKAMDGNIRQFKENFEKEMAEARLHPNSHTHRVTLVEHVQKKFFYPPHDKATNSNDFRPIEIKQSALIAASTEYAGLIAFLKEKKYGVKTERTETIKYSKYGGRGVKQWNLGVVISW